MAIKQWAAGVAVAAFAAVGAYVYLDTGRAEAPASTFVLLDGSSKSTADLKGKVTLVNFWATSCTTCVAEMPEIVATYNKYNAKGFDTLAVAACALGIYYWGAATGVPAHLVRLEGEDESEAAAETYTRRPAAVAS